MKHVSLGGSVFDPLQISLKFDALRLEALVNTQKTRFHIRIGLVNASIQPFDVVLSCYPPGYTNDER